MNIASVPCRCGQSWRVPGIGPAQFGTWLSSGAASSSTTSRRVWAIALTTVAVSENTGEQVA